MKRSNDETLIPWPLVNHSGIWDTQMIDIFLWEKLKLFYALFILFIRTYYCFIGGCITAMPELFND